MKRYNVILLPSELKAALSNLNPNDILPLTTDYGDYTLQVLAKPETRTTRRDYAMSTSKRVWQRFQVAFGRLVYSHVPTVTGLTPNWHTYKKGERPHPPRPAALIWRSDPEVPRSSVATLMVGEPGQSAEAFRTEVHEALPQLLTPRERFAARGNKPVKVLLAASKNSHSEAMLCERLRHELVTVGTARSVEEVTMALKTEGISVVIVAEQLPHRVGDEPVPTYMAGGLIETLAKAYVPCVGWMPDNRSHYHTQREIMRRLEAACGGIVLKGSWEPDRSPLDWVLDALGVAATKV